MVGWSIISSQVKVLRIEEELGGCGYVKKGGIVWSEKSMSQVIMYRRCKQKEVK